MIYNDIHSVGKPPFSKRKFYFLLERHVSFVQCQNHTTLCNHYILLSVICKGPEISYMRYTLIGTSISIRQMLFVTRCFLFWEGFVNGTLLKTPSPCDIFIRQISRSVHALNTTFVETGLIWVKIIN